MLLSRPPTQRDVSAAAYLDPCDPSLKALLCVQLQNISTTVQSSSTSIQDLQTSVTASYTLINSACRIHLMPSQGNPRPR